GKVGRDGDPTAAGGGAADRAGEAGAGAIAANFANALGLPAVSGDSARDNRNLIRPGVERRGAADGSAAGAAIASTASEHAAAGLAVGVDVQGNGAGARGSASPGCRAVGGGRCAVAAVARAAGIVSAARAGEAGVKVCVGVHTHGAVGGEVNR